MQVGGLARARAVQIHHVQPANTGAFQFLRQFKRVGGVFCFVREIALAQANQFAIE